MSETTFAESRTVPAAGGVAGWLFEAARLLWNRSARVRAAERELQVVETLALGGRKQLLLVLCGGQRFLVGTGPDAVQTIVQITGAENAAGLRGALAHEGSAR